MYLKRCLPIFFVFYFCMGFSPLALANPCLGIFTENSTHVTNPANDFITDHAKNNATEGFISYLDRLLEKRVIGERELRFLIETLEAGRLRNPIDEAKADLESELYEHFKGFEEYIERGDLDLVQILEWARERAEGEKEKRKERSSVQKDTKERIYQKMEWGVIPAGSFMMYKKNFDGVRMTLTHPFEAMTTQVTQWMWAEVMGENPSHFIYGNYSIVVDVNGKPLTMQPDQPVEKITFWSVLVYANRLSERDGLKPVYDFSRVKWKQGTSAEEGTLQIQSGKIKINAPHGDYYQAEGYRLPTEAEQLYLRELLDSRYTFSNDSELKDYAWYQENSQNRTHPVAELKPFLIDGPNGITEYYDLLGNVTEMGWDYLKLPVRAQENPIGKTADYRHFRPGAYLSGMRDILFPHLSHWLVRESQSGYLNTGFRLVKSRVQVRNSKIGGLFKRFFKEGRDK